MCFLVLIGFIGSTDEDELDSPVNPSPNKTTPAWGFFFIGIAAVSITAGWLYFLIFVVPALL
jgi:hypothetical protein